jgi:hypothetical protein
MRTFVTLAAVLILPSGLFGAEPLSSGNSAGLHCPLGAECCDVACAANRAENFNTSVYHLKHAHGRQIIPGIREALRRGLTAKWAGSEEARYASIVLIPTSSDDAIVAICPIEHASLIKEVIEACDTPQQYVVKAQVFAVSANGQSTPVGSSSLIVGREGSVQCKTPCGETLTLTIKAHDCSDVDCCDGDDSQCVVPTSAQKDDPSCCTRSGATSSGSTSSGCKCSECTCSDCKCSGCKSSSCQASGHCSPTFGCNASCGDAVVRALQKIVQAEKDRVCRQQELGDLVEEYNKLVKQERWAEAELIGKQAKELDPTNPVGTIMHEKARIGRQMARIADLCFQNADPSKCSITTEEGHPCNNCDYDPAKINNSKKKLTGAVFFGHGSWGDNLKIMINRVGADKNRDEVGLDVEQPYEDKQCSGCKCNHEQNQDEAGQGHVSQHLRIGSEFSAGGGSCTVPSQNADHRDSCQNSCNGHCRSQGACEDFKFMVIGGEENWANIPGLAEWLQRRLPTVSELFSWRGRSNQAAPASDDCEATNGVAATNCDSPFGSHEGPRCNLVPSDHPTTLSGIMIVPRRLNEVFGPQAGHEMVSKAFGRPLAEIPKSAIVSAASGGAHGLIIVDYPDCIRIYEGVTGAANGKWTPSGSNSHDDLGTFLEELFLGLNPDAASQVGITQVGKTAPEPTTEDSPRELPSLTRTSIETTVVTYPLRDLVLLDDAGHPVFDTCTFIDHLQSAVPSELWSHPSVSIQLDQQSMALVIRQTPEVHKQIESHLRYLRRLQIKQICNLIERMSEETETAEPTPSE